MEPDSALLEISLLNAEQKKKDFLDTVIELLNRGIPPEIVTRLEELWDKTKIIAGEIINIGRVIISQIVDFIKKNPAMAIGTALGAILGVMVGGIPFLGGVLQPLVTTVGMIYGAFKGASVDDGKPEASAMAGAISLAQKFLALFVEIMIAIKKYWQEPEKT